MKRALWLLPCLLSPLALKTPWAAVPANLGIGLGGYDLFEEWLTKYPNFHGVNRDVLLGMLCVIAVAVLPTAFALTALVTRFRQRWPLRIIAAIQVIFYAPVLIRLDLSLWVVGALSSDHDALIGPVMHLASSIGMGVIVFKQRRWVTRPLGVSCV